MCETFTVTDLCTLSGREYVSFSKHPLIILTKPKKEKKKVSTFECILITLLYYPYKYFSNNCHTSKVSIVVLFCEM